jgi:hypothetical protein
LQLCVGAFKAVMNLSIGIKKEFAGLSFTGLIKHKFLATIKVFWKETVIILQSDSHT